MKFLFTSLLISLWLTKAYTQFYENFSNPNSISINNWQGDTSFFLINADSQLQSNGPTLSSEIYLSNTTEISKTSVWEFYAQIDAASSSSNFSKFYLSADSADLLSANEGYYVRIGGESGNSDGIDLYRFEQNSDFKILDGIPGTVGKDSNNLRIKVSRDYFGLWSLFADSSGGNNLILQGTVLDSSISLNNFFGLYCKHSSTRSDKFKFDDIHISNGFFDIVAGKIIEDSIIRIEFSNPIDPAGINIQSDFSILPTSGSIIHYVFSPANPYLIDLYFNNHFDAGTYFVNVSNIRDLQGNNLRSFHIQFDYLPPPKFRQIVINEIMFDPEPAVGLPASEYVEIVNIHSEDFNLKDLIYSDANTSISLPDLILESGEYLILCKMEDSVDFAFFGKTLGFENWPTLNNSGDAISLKDKSGQFIDFINYDGSWSDGSTKSEGGWSFERINPFKICDDKDNWSYSIDGSGGTPGRINSIYNDYPDIIPPSLEYITIKGSNSISLHFSESLQYESINTAIFQTNPAIDIYYFEILTDEISITFNSNLDSGRVYEIFIDSIFDCAGNIAVDLEGEFGIGRNPSAFDLLITEFMFDPEPVVGLPVSEYIELMNNSDEIIDLNGTILISVNDTFYFEAYSLFPKEYLILSPESKVSEFVNYGKTLGLSPWPSLNNSEDVMMLVSEEEEIFTVHYFKEWIDDESKKDGGWALEMLDITNPCEGAGNWQASQNSLGGTPGKMNSFQVSNPDLSPPDIQSIDVLNLFELEIFFDEKIDGRSITKSSIEFYPEMGIDLLSYENRFSNHISIALKNELLNNTDYTFTLNNYKDCIGNYQVETSFPFILPETPDSGDIIINEILFDPYTGGSEFVEIYNRSSKNINLIKCLIGTLNEVQNTINQEVISENNLIIKPGHYLLIAKDTSRITPYYRKYDHAAFFEMSDLPALSNDGSTIIISDSTDSIIDKATYNSNYHLETLSDTKGISIERISTENNGLISSNWTSAAETFGFASPGIQNSHSYIQSENYSRIYIEPLIFSPDGDGYKDLIHFEILSPGINESIKIEVYNLKGQMIKNIANNSSLASRNLFTWNGIMENGKMSDYGNFIVLFDFYDLDGNREKIKKIISIGGRL